MRLIGLSSILSKSFHCFIVELTTNEPLGLSDEAKVVQVCKANYPLSLLEYNHCLHFLSNLEEMAGEARDICRKKSFPNDHSR